MENPNTMANTLKRCMLPHLSHSLKSKKCFPNTKQTGKSQTRHGELRYPGSSNCLRVSESLSFLAVTSAISRYSNFCLLSSSCASSGDFLGGEIRENFAESLPELFPESPKRNQTSVPCSKCLIKFPGPVTETKKPPEKPAWLWTAKSLSFKIASCSANSTDLVTWQELAIGEWFIEKISCPTNHVIDYFPLLACSSEAIWLRLVTSLRNVPGNWVPKRRGHVRIGPDRQLGGGQVNTNLQTINITKVRMASFILH